MKRYAICALVGTGTEEDMIRPKVANYPVNWSMVSGDMPTTWALTMVAGSAPDIAEVADDIDIIVLDCGPNDWDTPWEEVVVEDDRELLAAWTGYEVNEGATVFEVISALGNLCDSNFTMEFFNVSE